MTLYKASILMGEGNCIAHVVRSETDNEEDWEIVESYSSEKYGNKFHAIARDRARFLNGLIPERP
jgi:hypothetical protein